MCIVYVLRSLKTGRLYKGHTNDLERRLRQHNSSQTRSTKNGKPWTVVYSESFETRDEAVAREKYFKTYMGARELTNLIAQKCDSSLRQDSR